VPDEFLAKAREERFPRTPESLAEMFEKQEEWSKSTSIQQNLLGYAMEIGLDVDQFLVDVQASDIDETIDRNVAMGTAQKITGTPTFFLNGKLIQFRSYEELKQLVEAELSK